MFTAIAPEFNEMNPPSCPPLPTERSRDQEELIKFNMLNKMTCNYLVALGLTIEAENFRQTVNLNRQRCLTSAPVVDELLQHVAVQQQPNIEAQLFPTLAAAVKNGTTTTINAAATSAIDSATVPSCAGPPPKIAPTLPLAGPRIVYDGLPNSIAPKWPLVGPRILNHGASLGNTSMGCHFPIVAAQQHTKSFVQT